MIKIYLPNLNNKFYTNIKTINDNDIRMYTGYSQNIYRTHANLSPHIYIFDSSQINNEITQFIIEHTDLGFKIFIYHDHNQINKDCLRYMKQVKHIVEDTLTDNFKYHNIIQMPKFIINNDIYHNTNSIKIDRKIYFLDQDDNIPDSLLSNLYPKSQDKILMFNNPKISHYQNMGFVTEQDRAQILNTSKYFICNKNCMYAAEAYVCGCEILDMNNFQKHTINETLASSTILSYQNFIKKEIL